MGRRGWETPNGWGQRPSGGQCPGVCGSLLYFPVAAALLVLGLHLHGSPRPALGVAGVLVFWWAVCAALNARSWHEAHLIAERTLAAMKEAEGRFPPGATVFVDTLDAEEGAYVFRNGLREAARLRHFRADLAWQRGTAALVGSPEAPQRLGIDLFELGATRAGRTIDWTACERSLSLDPDRLLRAGAARAFAGYLPAGRSAVTFRAPGA